MTTEEAKVPQMNFQERGQRQQKISMYFEVEDRWLFQHGNPREGERGWRRGPLTVMEPHTVSPCSSCKEILLRTPVLLGIGVSLISCPRKWRPLQEFGGEKKKNS